MFNKKLSSSQLERQKEQEALFKQFQTMEKGKNRKVKLFIFSLLTLSTIVVYTICER